MPKITIHDLEVHFRVGVPDEERANPQRLLLTVDMDYDFATAALTDRVERTIDYKVLADRLLNFGNERSWKLIEKVAWNVADMVMADFRPQAVTVEVKKFAIPQAAFVSVTCSLHRGR